MVFLGGYFSGLTLFSPNGQLLAVGHLVTFFMIPLPSKRQLNSLVELMDQGVGDEKMIMARGMLHSVTVIAC